MKRIFSLTLIALMAVPTAAQPLTQEGPGGLGQPAEFAAEPSGIMVWASPIGRLESADSRALITAVAFGDRETQAITRGLRIDLIHLQASPACNDLRFAAHSRLCADDGAAIFVAEDELAGVRDDVERGSAAGNLIYSWRSSRGGVPLTSGLTIGGYTFAGAETAKLVTMIESGIVALAEAPR